MPLEAEGAANSPLLLLFAGADQEHDDQAGGGGDAEDAQELGEVFAKLGELHEIEHIHAEQERAQDDGNDTDQDQELPHPEGTVMRKVGLFRLSRSFRNWCGAPGKASGSVSPCGESSLQRLGRLNRSRLT